MSTQPVMTTVQVQRRNLHQSRAEQAPLPTLAEGQVLAEVEKFAFTANNVSYAVSGDFIGYWKYYPVDLPWGVIPVWGFARVVQSRSADLPVGERVWGFLPMATHVVLTPGPTTAGRFEDKTPHRADLPSLYNAYDRVSPEPAGLRDDQRCLLFPLFATSYLLKDWLEDNAWFGARRVVVVSASSKTGLGLCNLLSRAEGHPVQVVGLTSAANRTFVKKLGTCDQVATYDEIESLDASVPTAIVDMAGSADILRRLHERIRDQVTCSSFVGVTHWNARGPQGELPGATPTFFFAPAQVAKRDEDWGPGELLRRASAESARIADEVRGLLEVTQVRGVENVRSALAEMVEGRTPPSRGLMLSLHEE